MHRKLQQSLIYLDMKPQMFMIDASKWVIKTPQAFHWQRQNNSDCGILGCRFVKHMKEKESKIM